MNQVATLPARDAGDIMESVIVKGDLSKLSPEERSRYYGEVCRSVGLNPLTKPFEYITLNGKLTLYALRNCTDQLRQIHKVSVVDMAEAERDGVYIVTCKVTNGEGRTDMAKGAVALGTLKGEALCNAIMKAETKAKRRATLSICGLGWLDETEIETIPSARPMPEAAKPAIAAPAEQSPDDLMTFMIKAIEGHDDVGKLNDWCKRHAAAFGRLSDDQQAMVRKAADHRRGFLMQAPPHDDDGVVIEDEQNTDDVIEVEDDSGELAP